MKTRASLKNRQGGAVAVMVGISIVVLVGFLALVIDLGHLYIAKTELQNGADAAALAGAKQLDGTYLGCCDTANPNSGVNKAIAIAAQNRYDFSKPVDITIANISVGDCPDPRPVADGGCMVLASTVTTDSAAAGKTFLKVDTGPRQLGTWLAPVFNLLTGGNYSVTSTFGMAVAGRYTVDVAPLGICALDKTHPEFGFIRGVTYNIPEINPLSVQPDFMWLNPVDIPNDGTDTASCEPNHSSTSYTAPFVCTGKSAINQVPGWVYVNTGAAAALNKALNSRFDEFQGNTCDPVTAPPDTNIMQYVNDTDFSKASNPKVQANWMSPTPIRQDVAMDHNTAVAIYNGTLTLAQWRASLNTPQNWGVLWSASRERNFSSGADYTTSDWSTLYSGITASSYPEPSPYAQTTGSYFQGPSVAPPGKPKRRVVNMVIVDCPNTGVGKGVSCLPLPTLAIGKFFLPVKGNLPNEVFAEFVELFPTPLPPVDDIRLYQ